MKYYTNGHTVKISQYDSTMFKYRESKLVAKQSLSAHHVKPYCSLVHVS